MTIQSKYILDANILIKAHRQIYPFDLVPSFWEQLINKASSKIIILEKVEKEILCGQDPLAEWYNRERDNFTVIKIPDKNVIDSYRYIINSVNNNKQYKQSAKDEFASIADSWICAYALAYDATIVTLETYQKDIKKRVKIPNVCKEFKIKYIDMVTFMRAVGMRF